MLICETNTTGSVVLLSLVFFFFFWLCHTAWGKSSFLNRINPVPPAVEP